MKKEHFFHNAKWICAEGCTEKSFSVLRGYFDLADPTDVSVSILGLGFFKCYINGECINPDTFLPLSSDFEGTCDPVDEVISGHRIYVAQFDITPFVRNGKNSIAIHFGGGWYTFRDRVFGLPKAIYCINAKTGDNADYFVSDETCRIADGYVVDYDFTMFEHQDCSGYGNVLALDFDDSSWDYAVETEGPDTEYCTTDCPKDALIKKLSVERVGTSQTGVIYDCGENTTGYPFLKVTAENGERITVNLAEELASDGGLDPTHTHGQQFTFISDGEETYAQPEFTWFGFRYFEVIGNAVPEYVKVIHADVPVTSTFECDNETLNWTYKTFLHTMLCNMHTGHPSDCPHLERRGYTGDGQVTCNAVLTAFDARNFYEKWMQDIADSQDVLSGHIQYTAPYIRSGGGPGGWGCAVVEVPYQLYKHYGDKEILIKYYSNMRRYIDYLEAHSDYGLVTSDKKGEWCLGDWCGPNILYPDRDITSHNQQVFLPAPMVNTYFMVKSLATMRRIAQIIGRHEDIAEYDEKINYRKGVITAAYFNTFDDNFVMNVQGANSFAVDIGLGNEETYNNMVNYYKKLGFYDTGIFATDIVTRVLFERGDCDLAVALMTNNGDQGYEHWRRNGATTFHEYWDSNRSRSHSHPMFGSTVAYIFEYLLGIRQTEDSVGYASVVIAPQAVDRFGWMNGSIRVAAGDIAVKYEKVSDKVKFRVCVPEGVKATFRFAGEDTVLSAGLNEITR
ncbi:MAG: family 78 glycoside hydrolase catalytic domain [Clostridia bacterium]|nr:family 78 glycoside hydrolase catalytic domain [Clostridia bacterium]